MHPIKRPSLAHRTVHLVLLCALGLFAAAPAIVHSQQSLQSAQTKDTPEDEQDAPKQNPNGQRAPTPTLQLPNQVQPQINIPAAPSRTTRDIIARTLPNGVFGSQDPDQKLEAPSAIEEGGAGVYTLYVRSPQAIAFHGTYSGPHPPTREYPVVRWEGNVLRLAGLRHTGLDNEFERRFPNRGSAPPDSVLDARANGSFVEVPLNISNIPEQVFALELACRFGVFPNRRGIYIAGPFSDENLGAEALGIFYIRDLASDRDWRLNTVARLPVNLEPLASRSDLRSVGCSVQAHVSRANGRGIDVVPMSVAINARDPNRVIGFPGSRRTPSTVEVRADVEP